MTRTTPYNLLVGMIVALGSFTYGFGFASFATSLGQPGFYAYFNLSLVGPDAAFTNNILGAVNALFFFGATVGALTGGPAADRFGRRNTLMAASVLSVVGGALTAGSVHVAMLIVVRVLQGIGLGALATVTPIYLAEASTARKRGMLTGLHGFFLVSGYAISAWVGYGCYFSTNLTFGWRGPLAFTAVPALVLLVGCIFVPESPRWLLMQGREDEAWRILERLHAGEESHNSKSSAAPTAQDDAASSSTAVTLSVREEFYQMRKQIEFERANPSGYRALLTNKAYIKRTALSCYVQYAANSTGALVITNYSIIIYNNLGLTGSMPLLLYGAYTTVGAIGNLGSLLTMDYIGRRPMLLTGFIGCLIALILETAMVAEYVTGASSLSEAAAAGQKVAIFAIFLFVFAYGFFIDAASFVYSSEIYPTNVRARGVALSTATYFIMCLTYVTPGATAIATIGWRYYLVFICLTVVSVVVIYFFYPETKGKSLEELEGLFGDHVVVKLSDATAQERKEIDAQIEQEVGQERA
ncbi:general substrate transporter [Microdochium bolleyi]|uniref:General substrate transporter n=1 Tax=Microdochium bolleyi TaxID=196109 RepID=A0A136IRH5_9PEZI|nr:general substrate transporter [Microdochium bolleyi]